MWFVCHLVFEIFESSFMAQVYFFFFENIECLLEKAIFYFLDATPCLSVIHQCVFKDIPYL